MASRLSRSLHPSGLRRRPSPLPSTSILPPTYSYSSTSLSHLPSRLRSFRPSRLARANTPLPLLRTFASHVSHDAASPTPPTSNAAAAALRHNDDDLDPSSPPHSRFPVPPVSSRSTNDEHDLRAYFDSSSSPSISLSSSPTHSALSLSTGLFELEPLTHPSHLAHLTDRTLVHAASIVDRISRAPTVTQDGGRELRLVVKNLDRLSDLLCGVIDMCELVRNVHPEEAWVEGADRAYERLCSFMNGLNTDRGLFEALTATLAHPHAVPFSEAERQVALVFLRDFEKSGIDLPPSVRARFVELSDSLLSLGRQFLSSASSGPSSYPPIEISDPDRLLAGLGSQFIESLPRRRGKALVVPGSWEAQMIGRYAREGEARRLVYVGSQRPDPERIEVLETMLRERAELAAVLGKETWAEVVLADKMAKTPANVEGFLLSLAEHHKPSAAADVATLQRLKAMTLTGNVFAPGQSLATLPPLNAWDRDFFTERHWLATSPSHASASATSITPSIPPIAPYFSTGSVMRGLSRLFSRLYGISFRPRATRPGEVWHPSVRALDVVDETEGPVGIIYCDLFSRRGKASSAAHYTVRCSRRVDDDDVAGDGLGEGWDTGMGQGLETDGVEVKGKEGRYQLPIVVLTTDFGTVENGKPALLGWNDVETLFHEMGHAMHSMIGRTEFHNVSGTRCATDFVELPSILMEHFVSSPEVLNLFATHYATDEPLPMGVLEAHVGVQQSLAALETHGQILMALLDQRYHSLRSDPSSSSRTSWFSRPGSSTIVNPPTSSSTLSYLPQLSVETFDSTQIYNDLQRQYGVIAPVAGTAWQTQFGHLYGYGATYYSYLFDRAIAGQVFRTLFSDKSKGKGRVDAGEAGEAGPLSRRGGEVLKHRVLAWGGGRDPWEMVGEVVGGEEGEVISKGDERAMELVGSWTIK